MTSIDPFCTHCRHWTQHEGSIDSGDCAKPYSDTAATAAEDNCDDFEPRTEDPPFDTREESDGLR